MKKKKKITWRQRENKRNFRRFPDIQRVRANRSGGVIFGRYTGRVYSFASYNDFSTMFAILCNAVSIARRRSAKWLRFLQFWILRSWCEYPKTWNDADCESSAYLSHWLYTCLCRAVQHTHTALCRRWLMPFKLGSVRTYLFRVRVYPLVWLRKVIIFFF